MKATIKISIAILVIVFLQSCNMAKHYGNIRINHSTELKLEQIQENEIVKETKKSPQEYSSIEASNSDSNSDDLIFSKDSAFSTTIIDSTNKTPIENNSKPNLKTNQTIKKTNSNLRNKAVHKIISRIPKIKSKKIGSAQNELTIDEWGYIAIALSAVAFIVLVVVTGSILAAIILTVQFFLALMSLIAMGALLYGLWVILNFLGGGYA